MKRKAKVSKPQSLVSKPGAYILGMHISESQMYFLRVPTRYTTEADAFTAAKEKLARYGNRFTVYKEIAITKIEPSAVQLELFS